MVEDKRVFLVKVDTLKNVVDALKKSVSTQKFSWCREIMAVAELDRWLSSLVAPCGKKKTSGRMLGLCYIISTTSHAQGGNRGGDIPPVRCGGRIRGVTGGVVAPPVGVRGSALGKKNWTVFFSVRTHPWFCAWVFTWFWGMIVLDPWYFVDLVKGDTVMF